MKKFYSIVMMSLLAMTAWADQVTFDFSTEAGLSAMGITAPAQSNAVNTTGSKITVDGVTLTTTDGGTSTRVWNSQGTLTLRVYDGGSVKLAVASGSITGITVNAYSDTNFSLKADKGTYTVNEKTGTWTGSVSSVSLVHSGSKNSQISSIVVTTSEDAPTGDGSGFTPDPTKYQLDSLAYMADLDDGTEFQFTTEAFVNYQSGGYLYLQQIDEEGYAWAGLVYGNCGKEYKIGDIIPAGWTAKKTTYKGLVEATTPAGFENSIKTVSDPYYYEAFDMTGYLDDILDADQAWENFKVIAVGVKLSAIDDSGNFTMTGEGSDGTDVDVPGFNKFKIDYPTDLDADYTVEAMVTIYNNNYQIFPINIEKYEYTTKLWKVTYYGEEDGTQLTLNDSLYVATPIEDLVSGKKLIYVTDNVESILYDEYAAWGYTWYEDWYPDWIALDFTGNDELYNKVSQMTVIAPNTVKGVIAGSLTDPVLAVNSEPEELAVEDPEDIKTYIYELGGENGFYPAPAENLILMGATYHVASDGKCYAQHLADDNSVAVELVFDNYAPALKSDINEGDEITVFAVAKLLEPWEVSDDTSAPKKAAKQAPSKSKAKVAPAMSKKVAFKADPYAENYTDNIKLYVLDIEATPTAVEDITAKTVASVEYVNALGQTSKVAHDGFNVVKTTYTDGTVKTSKVIK